MHIVYYLYYPLSIPTICLQNLFPTSPPHTCMTFGMFVSIGVFSFVFSFFCFCLTGFY